MPRSVRWTGAVRRPARRSGAAVAFFSLITLGIYYAYWIASLHRETPARVGVDAPSWRAVGIPIGLGLLSIVPVVASGVLGKGEVDLPMFAGGMALSFVAHVLYLRTTWKLTDRLAGVGEAAGLDVAGLLQRRRGAVLGIASITLENVGLKSVDLLALDVPSWVVRLDAILLGLGVAGLWRWGYQCLRVANVHAMNERTVAEALDIGVEFPDAREPGRLGIAPRELSHRQRKSVGLLSRADWMEYGDDSGLQWFLESEDDLKEHGVVVPGTLVQANSSLFHEGESDHPGELLFSLADNVDPRALLELSNRLFALKGATAPSADEAFFAAHLADEMQRICGVKVPQAIAEIPEAYVSTTLFYRRHLPQGRIASGIYPVLVSPISRVAMVLPVGLWTREGYELYRETGGHEVR
ncbi:MAG: DUF4234 domain-containing protein [Planctomycetota bacterium]